MRRSRVQDREHDILCHRELCPWDCICWCHEGPTAVPTLPPANDNATRIRVGPPGKAVSIALVLNGQVIREHVISVAIGEPITIEPGPVSVRTIDTLTIEARLLP